MCVPAARTGSAKDRAPGLAWVMAKVQGAECHTFWLFLRCLILEVWGCYVWASCYFKGETEGIRDVKRCGTWPPPPSSWHVGFTSGESLDMPGPLSGVVIKIHQIWQVHGLSVGTISDGRGWIVSHGIGGPWIHDLHYPHLQMTLPRTC